MSKLPLEKPVFFKVLAVVLVLLVVGLALEKWLTGALPLRDIVGATVSSIILAYLVHLWMLPDGEPPEGSDGP
jgi:hypothetical protein